MITDGTYALDDDYVDPALIGVVDSHELVKIDTDGTPEDHVRFVFVDEPSCIGCYGCANVAPLTFMMEDEYGRARVMMQYILALVYRVYLHMGRVFFVARDLGGRESEPL